MLAGEWGWQMEELGWSPIKIDMPPAPQELLRVIKCNCNANCSSKLCSCKKHGLKCSMACGNCKGTGCKNSPVATLTDDEDSSGDKEP